MKQKIKPVKEKIEATPETIARKSALKERAIKAGIDANSTEDKVVAAEKKKESKMVTA